MKTWKIDSAHSDVKFKVKHLIVSTVSGQFNSFNAEIESAEDDFENAKMTFSAEIDSVDTGNEQRDAHLKSADFFDAEKNPKLTFVSKDFKKISGSKYELTGDFTIKGITKEITLDVEYNGKSRGFDNIEVAGFEITGKINRFEFGLQWNAMTEAGGVVVGPDVKLEIFAEMKETVKLSEVA